MEGVVAQAASQAPAEPGVYYFLGPDGQLLYVGKAAHLRRRLLGHARPDAQGHGLRLRRLYEEVADIRWETTPTEEDACAREVDVIVVLQPRFNASHSDGGRWVFVVVEPIDGAPDQLRIRLSPDAPRRRQVYGCFPHLGVGLASKTGIACSEGYAALTRLLWAASDPHAVAPFPRKISGPSPVATIDLAIAPESRPALGDLFAGTSRRLIDQLAATIELPHVEAYLRPALRRDVAAAERFYRHGPQALRTLRRRHRVPSGPMTRERVEGLIRDEVTLVTG